MFSSNKPENLFCLPIYRHLRGIQLWLFRSESVKATSVESRELSSQWIAFEIPDFHEKVTGKFNGIPT